MMTVKDIKWMNLCIAGAQLFSTCSRRQYFSVVLAPNGRLVGAGFNGSPPGIGHCVDGFCPRTQEDPPPGSSYSNCIAIHAERNALLWSDRALREGGSLVVNGPPCWDCGKDIAGSGVRRLVYLEDPAYAEWPRVAGLLEASGIQLVAVDRNEL